MVGGSAVYILCPVPTARAVSHLCGGVESEGHGGWEGGGLSKRPTVALEDGVCVP